MDGQLGRRSDGWSDGRTDGQSDGRMVRQTGGRPGVNVASPYGLTGIRSPYGHGHAHIRLGALRGAHARIRSPYGYTLALRAYIR